MLPAEGTFAASKRSTAVGFIEPVAAFGGGAVILAETGDEASLLESLIMQTDSATAMPPPTGSRCSLLETLCEGFHHIAVTLWFTQLQGNSAL